MTRDEAFAALADCERLLGAIAIFYPEGDDLTPLQELRIIDESLTSTHNREVKTLDGLESLEWVGSLGLSHGGFSELSALSSLEGVGDDGVLIQTQRDLVDLGGLDALRTVGGDCVFRSNEALTSIDGLGALEWVGGDLVIVGNSALTSIAALSSLRQVDGDLDIRENENLPAADVDALVARIQVGGQVFVDE